ncbi:MULTISPECIES: hypothetical protein [Streptomyces]|uniref:Uncharacterized protein n=1 Tax=Streptomyces spororaveus TaxID=284039 RepID=A0ABQ3T318_9ACTN|nr:hypothetical protein [Streptomyces spororaveus]MCM9077322.1 hypothetical protein [Streptomyces spororaveus]MCX5309278.1 hypothetical protein [Streptomyces sp. NBC_00160]GHI74783.1 hypothetical protein Sspor_03440 [Streptomyces spororaveus]
MTTAKLPALFRRTAEEDGQGDSSRSGAIRIGKWLFVPGSADCGVTRNATLEHESLEIDLSDSSTIFEEFLHRMSMIQTDFGRRLGNTAASAGGECPGGSSRV